jgi:hypothetical protein
MNFYEIAKEATVIEEAKKFVDEGIAAAAKAVKDGHKVGFLTARANAGGHTKIVKQIMLMVALKMSNKMSDFKNNFGMVKHAFDKNFFFFINDIPDTMDKLKEYLLPNMEASNFTGSTDQKKAFILKFLAEVYNNKLKFFDDEEKNIMTADKLKAQNAKIVTYDIKKFDEKKIQSKKSKYEKIFLFDVDGTLIDAEATVWLDRADGSRQGLSQEDFATGKFKLELGDKLNFKEFVDREHLTNLAKEFNEILKLKMLEKFHDMKLELTKSEIDDDAFSGSIKGKKVFIRKMPDSKYLMNYDGTISKSESLNKLLKNLKSYFSDVTVESISEFSEARVLKLGLKRIDKGINSIYRFKNYNIYLNSFDEGNNFAFIKESNEDDLFYLLTERQMDNYRLSNVKEIIKYLESNKERLTKWSSLKEMVIWLKDNRHLPINESYFRDIMIIED